MKHYSFGLVSILLTLILVAVVLGQPPERLPTLLLPEELTTGVINPGLPLGESKAGVFKIKLTAVREENGEYHGKLVLDPNAPAFDEFGQATLVESKPLITLECSLKLVKKKQFRFTVGDEAVTRQLIGIRGPKITSKIFLSKIEGTILPVQLLVHGKEGKVQYCLDLAAVQQLFEPCHPGCFPAGTQVLTPRGLKLIVQIGVGDEITTIDANGKQVRAKVLDIFKTRNQLWEVQFPGTRLITTETQPISMVTGGFLPIGKLAAKHEVWHWQNDNRQKLEVLKVVPKNKVDDVYNLVVGDQATFVANGFLVRSKPPAALPPP